VQRGQGKPDGLYTLLSIARLASRIKL